MSRAPERNGLKGIQTTHLLSYTRGIHPGSAEEADKGPTWAYRRSWGPGWIVGLQCSWGSVPSLPDALPVSIPCPLPRRVAG